MSDRPTRTWFHPVPSRTRHRVSPGAGRAIVLASTPYRGHQLYDQRLARALSRTGRDVVYVEPSMPLLRRAHHGAALPLSRVSDDGIRLLTPRMIPFGRRAPFAVFTALLEWLQIRFLLLAARGRTLHRFGGPDDTEVYICSAHPVLARAFRGWPRVVIVKDDYPAGGDLLGSDPTRLLRLRRALLDETPATAAVSPYLRQILLREGVDATVVPPGSDVVAPAPTEPEALRGVPHPRAAFVGMMSDRIDFDLLERVSQLGVTLVLAGRTQRTFRKNRELSRLLASGRAIHLGELDPADLGAALSHCDVGLVPYTLSPFNRACFPLKIFEYLAAGLPVFSTDLPAARWVDRPEVRVARAGADPGPALRATIAASAEAGIGERCREAAAANSWDERAQTLIELVHRPDPDAPARSRPTVRRRRVPGEAGRLVGFVT